MKRAIKKLIIALIFILAFGIPASAKDITVKVNTEALTFDQPPVLKNDRTMVPLRGVFEKMGAKVDWDDNTDTASVVKGDTEIFVTIGKSVMKVNGKNVKLDSEAILLNNRTLVPLRAISEAIGAWVEWSDEFYEVNITYLKDGVTVNPVDAPVKGVSHRGYNAAPENTLAAYRLSKAMGYSYVETDIQITKDGVPVLLHDKTLERTARYADGSAPMKGTLVKNFTLAELRKLDFGSFHSQKYKGERIPTLEEFIKLCVDLELYPYIEVKSDVTEKEFKSICDIINKYNMQDKISIIGEQRMIERVVGYEPGYRYGIVTAWIETGSMSAARRIKARGVDVFLDTSIVDYFNSVFLTWKDCMNEGIAVEVWTYDDEEFIADLIKKGVTGITTNSANIMGVIEKYKLL